MFKSSFSVRSRVQDVTIEGINIKGESDNIRSYLKVFIDFRLRALDNFTQVRCIFAKARLYFSNGNFLVSVESIPIGLSSGNTEYNNGYWFDFLIDEKALFAIEKNRNGDVGFRIELNLSIILTTRRQPNLSEPVLELSDCVTETSTIHFQIPKSKWVEEIINKMGYRNLRLVEIPVNHRLLKEAYTDIVEEFNLAEEYFNNADYNKCVAHCRSTLDALTRNLKKIKANVESETAFKWLNNIDSVTLTWLDELDKSSVAIASKTHHAGLKRNFERYEAESIYLVVLGLLNYLGQLKARI